MHDPGDILIRAEDGPVWWRFRSPSAVVQARAAEEAPAALAEAAKAVDGGGLAAVGFLTYEASPGFDQALVCRPAGPLPAVWFGLYERAEPLAVLPVAAPSRPEPLTWEPNVGYEEYRQAIRRVKAYIATGDTYQVNYTLRLRAPFAGDPAALFAALWQAQRAEYCAYVHIGDHVICSASPELFFRLHGETVLSRPMKGTAPRGRTLEEDEENARALAASEKDRAENVMIVDMIRNDLGRIARVGSVRVPRLFTVERYDTLFQMTSDVEAEVAVGFPELMGALFPCASITGAPKVRTMEIIRELEPDPRGIYTGCIGYLLPGRRARFSVAIRTVHVDLDAGRAEYGTGGGIVWDSTEEGEYEECHTKALILLQQKPEFQLLETLLWEPDKGYALLERHLSRLAASARYFGFALDPDSVRRRLAAVAQGFGDGPQRVRLLVGRAGEVSVEAAPLPPPADRPWRVGVAKRPVDPKDRFLYHKTTHRAIYEQAKADFPNHDDVLLWNPQGEATESTIANLVVRLGGELVTPPVSCGLLPGTLRAELLNTGQVRERVVTLTELAAAEEVWLVNSVRGWIRVQVDWPQGSVPGSAPGQEPRS